jgi:thymidylate synthase (FAD)
MKIIKPNVELIVNDGNSMEFIERIGRTCYKSTDKITEGSAKTFVQTLLKRQHYAMLEHDVIYVKIKTYSIYENCVRFINQFSRSSTGNSYINVGDYNKIGNSSYIISGNMRAFIELINERVRNYQAHHFISSSSDFLCFKIIKQYPDFFDEKAINLAKSDNVKNSNLDNLFEIMSRKEFIDKASDDALFQHLTHTILFTCDRGVSHELVRHRPCSFAQESTRYCNYSMDKYDNNITVIEPFFFVDNPKLYDSWLQACLASEKAYLDLIENGASAQQARSVLPNSLKT